VVELGGGIIKDARDKLKEFRETCREKYPDR
jgi:hypothetical protein